MSNLIYLTLYSWSKLTEEHVNLLPEKENECLSSLTSISDDIRTFTKYFNFIIENLDTNNNSFEDAINEIKTLKLKYSNIKENLSIYQKSCQIVEEFAKKMKSILIKAAIQINLVFTNYHAIKKNLLEIMERLEKYGKLISSVEKDFSYLQNPSYFPQAYYASILEIKRRIIFNRKMMKDFERIKQLVTKENINRKLFIQEYGKYLTNEYVPQLKFTELKISIEFENNNELINLPNILEEEEENTINNHNLCLEYEDNSSLNSQNDNLFKNNNNNNKRKYSEETNGIPSHNDTNNNTELIVRNLNNRIAELEIMLIVKENELKKYSSKLEQKDRKITNLQTETEKLANSVERLSEIFIDQIKLIEQKHKEKSLECENLNKIINNQTGNKLDNCPMCKDIANNSIEYQGWGEYVREYHNKVLEKNKQLSKVESRFQELVIQTNFLKRTYFQHLNTVLESKNLEIITLKASYENKLMTLEDFLSAERENNAKIIQNNINNNITILEEEVRQRKMTIAQLENKIKDINKAITNYEVENKKLKTEKDSVKKLLEECKLKENNLIVDNKMKDTKIETLQSEMKKLEKECDNMKKNINQLSEEVIGKIKEYNNVKCNLENKQRLIEELQKALENSKVNHIEMLNEIHKANQNNTEKLNQKIDELTKMNNEKNRNIEDIKFKNTQLIELNENYIEDMKQLKENIETLSQSKEDEIKKLTEEDINKINNYENLNNSLKKKVDDLQHILNEKEKKLSVNIIILNIF
jgi:hypothetical protein